MRFALLCAALLAACQPAPSALPPGAPEVVVSSSDGLYHTASWGAVGDSLRLTVTATSARATGYIFNVTAVESGWSGLPTNQATAVGSLAFTAVHLAAWDSVHFTACAIGTQGTKQSAQSCAAVTFKRGPGPPVVGWDSSLTVTQLIVKPDTGRMATGSQDYFCGYWRALDGMVRMNSGQETIPVCRARYDSLPASETLPGYPVAMSRTPYRSAGPGLRLVLRTPRDELAHLMFGSPFQQGAV